MDGRTEMFNSFVINMMCNVFCKREMSTFVVQRDEEGRRNSPVEIVTLILRLFCYPFNFYEHYFKYNYS